MSARETVIDADGHVTEPAGLWQQYLEPAYRERAPRFAMSERGEPCMVADGRFVMRHALRLTLGAASAADGYQARAGGFAQAERLRDLGAESIRDTGLFTTLGRFVRERGDT